MPYIVGALFGLKKLLSKKNNEKKNFFERNNFFLVVLTVAYSVTKPNRISFEDRKK